MKENMENKIRKVQQITIEYKRQGLSQKEIYWRYIHDQFFICMGTYNRYLRVKLGEDQSSHFDRLSARR